MGFSTGSLPTTRDFGFNIKLKLLIICSMKKILIILSFFAVIVSCGKLEDLNKNIKDPAAVPGETLFTGAQRRVGQPGGKYQCKPE